MIMASNHINAESPEKFGLEDCEALLQFPYHAYIGDVKQDNFSESDACSSNPNVLDNSSLSSFDASQNRLDIIKEEDIINYEKCLEASHTLQEKYTKALEMVQIALEKNIANQNEVNEILRKQSRKETSKLKVTRPISLFASPYFRDVRGRVPPDNEDAIEKMKRHDVTAYSVPPKPWSTTQKDSLTTGVIASALDIAIKPYAEKRDYLMMKLKDKNLLDDEIVSIKKTINDLKRTIALQSQRDTKELLKEAEGKIDWLKISATNLQGTKNEEECEIMWNNYLSPFVNKDPFNANEDRHLKRLAYLHKRKNWDVIAEELNTGRTAIQCLERYQKCFNPKLTKKYWTPKEDAKLMQIVELNKIGNYIPWNKVCCYMDGRARYQIINRYERTICKEIKRTPFTVQEDAMLIACVKRFGNHWIKMKDFLPGRSTYAIRERYVNTLDPTLKMGDWTKEEDTRLIELINKHGYGKWAKIARDLTCRTDNMCLVRARILSIHSGHKLKKKKISADAVLNLKPNAPSKNCRIQNSRLKFIRENAQNTLRIALQNVKPDLDVNIDMANLDLSCIPITTLKLLHNELFKEMSCESTEDWTPHYVPPQFQQKSSDEEEWSDEDEDSPNEDEPSKYKEGGYLFARYLSGENKASLSRTNKIWLHRVLKARLKEQAILSQSGMKPKSFSLNAKETAECAYYSRFLRKKMSCSEKPDDLNCQFDESYENSISEAIRYFIEPDAEEGQPIVLCPNLATSTAFESMELTKKRLRKTGAFLNESKPYLRYLVENTDKTPQCSKCRKKTESSPEYKQFYLQSMHNSLLILDDELKQKAETELGSSSEICKCKELIDSRKNFNLLKKRFLSMFLWNYLLSTTDLSSQQKEIINKSVPNKYNISGPSIKKEDEIMRKRARPKSLKIELRDGVKRKRGRPKQVRSKENEARQNNTKQCIKSVTLDINEDCSNNINEATGSQTIAKIESERSLNTNLNTSNLRRSRRSCVLRKKSLVEESDTSS